jgi:hypothetical protein
VRPRVRVVLGDPAEQHVDAVVRPVGPRRLALGACRTLDGPGGRVIEVGCPVFSPARNREHELARAYRAALAAADAIGARTIAVPTELTTSPWPIEHAVRIALGTIESTPTRVHTVVVATRTPAALEAWAESLARR